MRPSLAPLTFLQGGHPEPVLLGLLLRHAVTLRIYKQGVGEEGCRSTSSSQEPGLETVTWDSALRLNSVQGPPQGCRGA